MLNTWDYQIKNKEEPSIVIPLIVYHGKSSWNYRDMEEYFAYAGEEINPYIPSFRYLLTDLSQVEEQRIKQLYKSVELQAAFLIMKNIFDNAKFEANLSLFFSNLSLILQSTEGLDFFGILIRYIFSNVDINNELVIEAINKVSKKGRNLAMTIEERLIQKGMEKGMERGIQRGMEKGMEKGIQKGMERGIAEGIQKKEKEFAIELIKKGMDDGFISDVTKISIREVKKIREQMQE